MYENMNFMSLSLFILATTFAIMSIKIMNAFLLFSYFSAKPFSVALIMEVINFIEMFFSFVFFLSGSVDTFRNSFNFNVCLFDWDVFSTYT